MLAPYDIAKIFPHVFTLPMVKTHTRAGKAIPLGLRELARLVEARAEVGAVFRPVNKVLPYLCRFSGGSVRDLVRLIGKSGLIARVQGKDFIDPTAAKDAVKDLRLGIERYLIPGNVYYPLLAQVHATKRASMSDSDHLGIDQVQNFRDFLSELLFNGWILEYDGGDNWYDVHPIVQEIEEFKEAKAAHGQAKGK